MIVYDVATKVLDTESFPQHIAGLISGITFIVLFSQEKPLRWKEINTHTHKPGTSAQYQLLQKSYILEKANFPHYLLFQESYFFRVATYISERRVTISQLRFVSTAAFPIYHLVIK